MITEDKNRLQDLESKEFWHVRLNEIMFHEDKPSCFYYYGYPKRATFDNVLPVEDSSDLLEKYLEEISEDLN